MNSIITLNELDQFQQAEDLRRESFIKQICKMEEYIFARNVSIAENKLSDEEIDCLNTPDSIPDFNSAEWLYNKSFELSSSEEWRLMRKKMYGEIAKARAKDKNKTPYNQEMYEAEYGEKIAIEKKRKQDKNFLDSGMQMMRIHSKLLKYDAKRMKLFERAKKIGMTSAEWSNFDKYLKTIEQQILTNLEFDDFYLLVNDIERLFNMITGLLVDKLSHCMARPIRIIKNLIDSGKNLVNKVISAIKPEKPKENSLSIDESRKIEENMASVCQNAQYLEQKASDNKPIKKKESNIIRQMLVDQGFKIPEIEEDDWGS